jgi:hypothetical protein
LRQHRSPTIRWRAAHALGAWPSDPVVGGLRHALLNDERWVRYGAVRSLIDLAAAADAEARDEQLRWFIDHLDRIKSMSEQVVDELERALVRVPPPNGWVSSAGNLVEALYASEETEHRRDRWRRLAARLRRTEAHL